MRNTTVKYMVSFLLSTDVHSGPKVCVGLPWWLRW